MAAVCVAGGDECVGVSEGRLAAAGRGRVARSYSLAGLQVNVIFRPSRRVACR